MTDELRKDLLNGEIIYLGTPFMAIVDGNGGKDTVCIPAVYNSIDHCGVVISYENQVDVCGPIVPRKVVESWRATELLRLMSRIENKTLCYTFKAAYRKPEELEPVDYVISTIGKDAYDQVMMMPVPDEVIQAIIDLQCDGAFAPEIDTITEEIRAGTVKWRPEFASFGIERPEEADAREKLIDETAERFEELLQSYASFISHSRGSLRMQNIEVVLASLAAHEVDKECGDDLALALAGAVGSMLKGYPRKLIALYQPLPGKRDVSEAIRKSSEWLAKTKRISPIYFWREADPLSDKEKAREAIEGLFAKFFSNQAEATQQGCATA